MTPTNEQIIAEANRRRQERGKDGQLLVDFIIEVMRENWTPPEPVDPDVLAWREWGARRFGVNTASIYRRGDCDNTAIAEAYFAGARMAREQERERAKVLVWELDNIADADQDEISDIALKALAKYRGEA